MEINNWFDFIIYTIYFFGVVIVILPTGVIFLWLTLKNLVKMRAPRYEKKHYKYFSARNRFEVCVAGVFSVAFSVLVSVFCQRGKSVSLSVRGNEIFFRRMIVWIRLWRWPSRRQRPSVLEGEPS
nr:hypothetical protein AIHLHEEL_00025 [Escherichia coli]